jgi:antirestriction protein ArdC
MTNTTTQSKNSSNKGRKMKTTTSPRINSKKEFKKMTNKDVYTKITNLIIEQLNNGHIPWENPNINGVKAQNIVTGHFYSGVNPLILQMSDTPFFMTFKQAKALKASIKKGAKSYPVIFWSTVTKNIEDKETGEEEEKTLFILKYYNVFKITDIDNLPEKLLNKAESLLVDNKTIISCEEIINNYPDAPKIKNFIPNASNSSNGYSHTYDAVFSQPLNMFKSENHYYSTMFHELIHSTGHLSRLNRLSEDSLKFGSKTYAKEELVADLGAAYLISEAGQNINIENKAAYIQSWLKVLKNDNKMIITAAGRAEKAVNHILNNKEFNKSSKKIAA